LSSNLSNSSQGAIQQYPTNYPTYPIGNPTGLSNLDKLDIQSIQQAQPTIQQQREGQQQQQPIFELDITPEEDEAAADQVGELSEKEVAEIAASDSKFPVAEFIRIVGRIKSVSNMISRARKDGATEQRLAQLQADRKDLKIQKVAAEKALEASGISVKDIKEGKA
jgi:hypothetical protein